MKTNTIELKINFLPQTEEDLAYNLMYDFEPIERIVDRYDYPTIEQTTKFINDIYNAYLEGAKEWKREIITSKELAKVIIKHNFYNSQIKEIKITEEGTFRIEFKKPIKFDENKDDYLFEEEKFWELFDPYFDEWEKEIDIYTLTADGIELLPEQIYFEINLTK